jgi:hypothetical protein
MLIMMELQEPMIVIDGTEATISLLPRLGWKPLPAVEGMTFPVPSRDLVGNLLRRKGSRHLNACKDTGLHSDTIPANSFASRRRCTRRGMAARSEAEHGGRTQFDL